MGFSNDFLHMVHAQIRCFVQTTIKPNSKTWQYSPRQVKLNEKGELIAS